jgi:hypothetical protein
LATTLRRSYRFNDAEHMADDHTGSTMLSLWWAIIQVQRN